MKTYKNPASIKVGVVGYGGAFNMGRQHLKEMQAAGMTPVAVAEVDPSRLAVATLDFPDIGTYPSVTEMLECSPVDMVVIITPHNTHAPIAIECLKAGRHVVCEKPLAITTSEVDAMIKAASRSEVMLSTYHNRHWDGRILQAVDLVNKKKTIGDVVRIECHKGGYSQPGDWWRTSRSISGGILYDWGVHLLEYSLQLIEAPVQEVSGFSHEGFWAPKTKWKNDANEDEAFVVVRFEGGQWLTLAITHLDSKAKEGWLEITGTKGTLVIDSGHTVMHQHLKGKSVTTRLPHPPDQGHKYYENVAEFLTGRSPLVITGEWSRRPIHILDLAAQSARTGKSLRAKYG
ncbi:MAG: Gfo/Idh/MocA family oxidoreductase [Verrucomicrobiae bacterium]